MKNLYLSLRIGTFAVLAALACGVFGATITSIPALPTGGGVFSQANLDAINTASTTANTNFTNVNSSLATINTTLASVQAGTGITAGAIGTTQLNPNTIQFVSVPLTLSALQTLNSVPVQVVAAAGSGTLIEIQSCVLDLKRGSAAFTGGGTVTIGYGASTATTAAAATVASTVFTTFAASQMISVAGALPVTASSLTLNLPVWVAAGSADFASGTGGSGVLDCAYRVHTGL